MHKNHIQRFLIHLLLLIALLVIIDQALGIILRKYYFLQVAGAAYRATYSIDSTRADILVFGSSRANHHYVPEVFEDSLGLSFYNTGRDGNFLIYNVAVLRMVLSRYIPKIILLDIRPGEFNADNDSYDRLSSLLPYYKSHPEIHDIVERRSPYEKIKLLSATYPFNSTVLTIAVGNLELNKTRKADNKGYIPLYRKMGDTSVIETNNATNLQLDSIKIHYLDSFAGLCKEKGIRLYIVHSPIFTQYLDSKANEIISEVARRNDAIFINYANDTAFINNPALFQDENHLNHEGAVLFSGLLAGKIIHARNADALVSRQNW